MTSDSKWWVQIMGAAKWIRFAVLVSFAGLFVWLAYVRGQLFWLLPGAVFLFFALVLLFRASKKQRKSD